MALFQSEALNRGVGNFCFNSGGIAESTADVATANTLEYTLANVFFSAAPATITLAGTTFAEGGSLVLADSEVAEVYLTVDSDGTFYSHLVRTSWYRKNGVLEYDKYGLNEMWEPENSVVCFGKLILENTSGSDFTVGTDALAGITAAIFNVSRFPGYEQRPASTGLKTY